MYKSEMVHAYSTSSLIFPNCSTSISSAVCPPNSISNSSEHPNTSSENASETDDMMEFDGLIRTVVPILFGSVGLLGFLGNFVVIATILFDQKLRCVTNILVLNLASADLVFITLCVPFTASSYVTTTWPFGSVWCKVHQFLIHVTAHASVYTLVLMSLDRYLAVVHPIGSIRIRTQRYALLVIICSWMLLGACNSPMLQIFDVLEFQFNGQLRSICIDIRILNDFSHGQIFYGTFFLFAFALPLLLVSLLYGRLLSNLRTNGRWRPQPQSKIGNWRTKRRVTRMVVIVVAVFGVCWLPLQVVFLAQFVIGFPPHLSSSAPFVLAKVAATCLAYANSAVNPILYGFLSDNFRQSFRRLLRMVLGWVSCGGAAKNDLGQKDVRNQRQKTGTLVRNQKQQSAAVAFSSSALHREFLGIPRRLSPILGREEGGEE